MHFLYEKDEIIYAACDNCGRELKFKKYELQDIKTGVECFCGISSNVITGLPEERKVNVENRGVQNVVAPTPEPVIKTSVPRCPTCGSTNISKISLTSKAVGGAMFGIFSSNIRNTYKCNVCGYKW